MDPRRMTESGEALDMLDDTRTGEGGAGRRRRRLGATGARSDGLVAWGSRRPREAESDVVHLTLAGLSEDGKRLLLVSDAGVEFTLDIDAKLRAALRGDHASLGQLEIKMDSVLRPRDIQARI